MTKINLVESKVKEILERYPEARNSDKILAFYYYRINENLDLSNLFKTKTSLETVTRCRRKIQERKECEATLSTKQERKVLENQFKGYSHE